MHGRRGVLHLNFDGAWEANMDDSHRRRWRASSRTSGIPNRPNSARWNIWFGQGTLSSVEVGRGPAGHVACQKTVFSLLELFEQGLK